MHLSEHSHKIVCQLKDGSVGILPTDTLYGLVGSALNEAAVERIFSLKKRSYQKPLIVLISKLEDLKLFGVALDERKTAILQSYWPGPVSIILYAANEKFRYLHRGSKTIAFRLPDEPFLLDLLGKTGPLVAPTANLEGCPPSKTIEQAREYFKNNVDFYLDAGRLDRKPSTLISLVDDEEKIIRS